MKSNPMEVYLSHNGRMHRANVPRTYFETLPEGAQKWQYCVSRHAFAVIAANSKCIGWTAQCSFRNCQNALCEQDIQALHDLCPEHRHFEHSEECSLTIAPAGFISNIQQSPSTDVVRIGDVGPHGCAFLVNKGISDQMPMAQTALPVYGVVLIPNQIDGEDEGNVHTPESIREAAERLANMALTSLKMPKGIASIALTPILNDERVKFPIQWLPWEASKQPNRSIAEMGARVNAEFTYKNGVKSSHTGHYVGPSLVGRSGEHRIWADPPGRSHSGRGRMVVVHEDNMHFRLPKGHFGSTGWQWITLKEWTHDQLIPAAYDQLDVEAFRTFIAQLGKPFSRHPHRSPTVRPKSGGAVEDDNDIEEPCPHGLFTYCVECQEEADAESNNNGE